MARIRDLLSSIGEVFQSKTSSLAGRTGERRTGVDDLNDAFCTARRALQAGRPREAADRLETTLENMSVVMAASWAVVGDARMQLGERRRGEEAYRRAAKELKGTRHVPDADQALAITSALIALDKRKDAVELLTAAAERHPERDDVLARLAEQLEAGGDQAGAARVRAARAALVPPAERVVELRRAIELDPTQSRYLQLLGAALLATGDTRGALEAVEQVARAMPERDDVTALLAETLRRIGDQAGALERAEHVLDRDADHVDALMVRAHVRQDQGQVEEAMGDVEHVLVLSPAHVEAHATRFELVLALGRADDVIADIHAVAADDPERAATMAQTLAGRRDDLAAAAFDELLGAEHPPARAWLGRGQLRYADNDPAGAEPDFERAVQTAELAGQTDVVAEALAWLGENRRSAGEVDGALDALDRSLAIQQTAFALGCRGRVRALRGDRQAAIADLSAAAELSPGVAWVRLDLAEQYRLENDLGRASTALDEAEASGDDSAYLHATRGQVLRAQGRVDEAIGELQRAFALEQPAWISNELADVLLEVGRSAAEFQAALDVVEQGLAVTPTSLALLRTKAEALRLLGRTDEGLVAIDEYLRSSPTDETALASRAHLLVDVGTASDALDAVDTTWGDDLGSLFAQSARLRALSALNRQTEALALLARLVDRYPADSWLPQMRVSLLVDLLELPTALEEATVLLADNAANRWMHGCAGYCYRRLDPPDVQRAIDHLRLADDGDQPDLGIKIELAEALRMAGDPAAEQVYEQVVRGAETERHDPWTMSMAAWACLRLGRAEEAVAGFESAVRLDPARINDHFNLGLALLNAGRGVLAEDQYEDGVERTDRHPDRRRAVALVAEAITDLHEALPGFGATESWSVADAAATALALLDGARARLDAPLADVSTT